MTRWRDRINRFSGKTRLVVCRIFIHLNGPEVTPLLGTLNQVARGAIEADGDLEVFGEGLTEICQQLLSMQSNWQAAANEGDEFWDEGEAGDYFNELFTDSASRYLSQGASPEFNSGACVARQIRSHESDLEDEILSLPATSNLIVMITVGYEGEAADLETNLADLEALEYGLKALINLNYGEKIRAIGLHFSPAQFGDQLTDDQVLINFPELIPL